jgi:K+-sensing histidine kinase KdpD
LPRVDIFAKFVTNNAGIMCFYTYFGEAQMNAKLRPWVGIGICIAAATLLCVLLKNSADTRFVAPAVSLQAVILAALFFGGRSALIGSVATSLILMLFLFPPRGSVFIRDPLETAMLVLFQAASIVIAVMSPSLRSRQSNPFLL